MTGTNIPLSVTPNTIASLAIGDTLSEVGKECKSTSKNNIKSKTGRNGSKKARKSLLQEQQEVLQKNGKNATETKLKDKNEDSKGNVNVVSGQGDTIQDSVKTLNAGTSISGSGSHPRNRWRCMQPRVCNYCWKTFSNSFNLKQHIVNVHVQSQGVSCSLCEKVVKNKWYLRKHLVTAHGAPLKRIKGNEGGTGGSGMGITEREANTSAGSDPPTKGSNNEQTDSIDAAAAVAAAAAAANIPLATFVAAANNISQQHQNNINNNIAAVATSTLSLTLNGNTGGHGFVSSTQTFSSETINSNTGSIIGIPDVSERKRLSKRISESSKDMIISTEENEEDECGLDEEEEELIVDT